MLVIAGFGRLLFSQGVQRFKAHAFEIFFLELGSLLGIYLLWIELKVGYNWSMIRKSALLCTKHHFLFNLRIFVAWDLPQDSVTPGWYPHLFTCIVVLRSPVIFVGWCKLDFPLSKVSIKLVLQLDLIFGQLILLWHSILLKGLNHFIMLFEVLPILYLACGTNLVIWQSYAIV